jgi:hypothetical protein
MIRPVTSRILLLLVICLLASTPAGQGQTSTTTSSGNALTVGLSRVKPTIDGVWGYGEWSDANEARLAYYFKQVNHLGQAYLRLKYDKNNLYLLFDVTSDNGTTSPPRVQFILISFDTNNDGFSANDTTNDFFMTFSVNGTRLNLNWFGTRPSYVGEILGAQHVGFSPHLTPPHRVYEVSIPTSLVLRENLTAIGFNACADDSYGNILCISDPNSPFQVELTFASIAVPENITLLLPLLVTLGILSLFGNERKRKASSA